MISRLEMLEAKKEMWAMQKLAEWENSDSILKKDIAYIVRKNLADGKTLNQIIAVIKFD